MRFRFFQIFITITQLGFSQATFFDSLSMASITLSKDEVIYDGSYRSIPYPNGDVPVNVGVCTDVIIRAYRKMGVDLQKEIHEDILKNRAAYWRVINPDANIDHRRVPNMQVYFKSYAKVLPISNDPNNYKPGDIVCWKLGGKGGIDHIGLVVNRKSFDEKRYLVIHNIGGGQNIEDFLFGDLIVGHYRFKK
jgi:uncharacterized protein